MKIGGDIESLLCSPCSADLPHSNSRPSPGPDASALLALAVALGTATATTRLGRSGLGGTPASGPIGRFQGFVNSGGGAPAAIVALWRCRSCSFRVYFDLCAHGFYSSLVPHPRILGVGVIIRHSPTDLLDVRQTTSHGGSSPRRGSRRQHARSPVTALA